MEKELEVELGHLKKLLTSMDGIEKLFVMYFDATKLHSTTIKEIITYLQNNKQCMLELSARLEKLENKRRVDDDVMVV